MKHIGKQVDYWYIQLETVFNKYNETDIDPWQKKFYKEKIEKSYNENTFYEYKDSSILLEDNTIFFIDWKNTPEDNIKLLLLSLNINLEYNLLPLGNYLFEIAFLLNRHSIIKYNRAQSPFIILDKNKIQLLQDTVEWMMS